MNQLIVCSPVLEAERYSNEFKLEGGRLSRLEVRRNLPARLP